MSSIVEIGVVAHERRHVEGGREAVHAVLEEVLEALVGVVGGAEAGELAHGPEAAAVALGEEAAGVGEGAGRGEFSVQVGWKKRIRKRREALPCPSLREG